MANEDIHTTAAPPAARDAALHAFAAHDFTVSPTSEYAAVVERGSKSATVWLGALAGKGKQHVRYEVSVFASPEGGSIVRMVSTTSGVAAGIVGMSRERKLYQEWHGVLYAALPH
jgi:hypothetical protein